MLESILHDPKVALATVFSLFMTSVGRAIELIPNDIGKVSALIGIILSIVLIYTHLKNGKVNRDKTKLEMELIKRQLDKRL